LQQSTLNLFSLNNCKTKAKNFPFGLTDRPFKVTKIIRGNKTILAQKS